MDHQVKLLTLSKKDETFTRTFTAEVDGVPVTGKVQFVGFPNGPKFTYRINTTSKLLRGHPDYKIIRYQLLDSMTKEDRTMTKSWKNYIKKDR